MAKNKLITILNFRLPALEAKNDSIVGPTFGQYGIKGMDFCKKFNEYTAQFDFVSGFIFKVLVYIYKDRSFSFLLRTPPLFFLFYLVSSDLNVINIRDIYKITLIKSLEVKHVSLPILYKNILFSLKTYKYTVCV